MLRISLGSDHRGVSIRQRLIQTLENHHYICSDEGAFSTKACDYPDIAATVARKVSRGEADRGILICGTGIGMAITANKFPGVRAAPCYEKVMVEMSRRHNDVNVLCLPGDMIGERPIDELVLLWLKTEFEGGRHARRVQKISGVESALTAAKPAAHSAAGSQPAAEPPTDTRAETVNGASGEALHTPPTAQP